MRKKLIYILVIVVLGGFVLTRFIDIVGGRGKTNPRGYDLEGENLDQKPIPGTTPPQYGKAKSEGCCKCEPCDPEGEDENDPPPKYETTLPGDGGGALPTPTGDTGGPVPTIPGGEGEDDVPTSAPTAEPTPEPEDDNGRTEEERGGCPPNQCCSCGSHTGPDGEKFNAETYNDGSYSANNDSGEDCCPPVKGGDTGDPGDGSEDPGGGIPVEPTSEPTSPPESLVWVCNTRENSRVGVGCTNVDYGTMIPITACRAGCAPDCDTDWLRVSCYKQERECYESKEICDSNCIRPRNFQYYCKSMVPTPWVWNAHLTPTPDPLTPTPTRNPLTPTPVPTIDDTSTSCASWANWYLDCPCEMEDGCFFDEGVCRTNCAPWSICNVEEKSCYRGYYLEGGSKCNTIEYPNYCYRHATEEYPIGVIDDECRVECADGGSSPPTLPDDPIDISNDSDLVIIPPDSEERNHVCQVDNKDKIVLFYVTVQTDVGSSGDNISTVGLRFDIGGTNNLTLVATNLGGDSRNAFVASGVGMAKVSVNLTSWQVIENARTVVFKVDFNDGFPTDLSSLQVSAIDIYDNNLMATDIGRKFKYWDCKVDYSGSLFDDSGNSVERQVCSVSGYGTPISDDLNFRTLEFINTDDTMPAIKIDGNSFAQTAGKELLWGSSYTAKFNSDFFAESPLNRTIDLNVGTTLCNNSPGDVLDLGASSGGSFPAFPYVDNPAIKIDFSWLGYAEAWFQVIGGGIQAGGDVINIMPGGEKMSIGNSALGTDNDSWIIAEGSIVKGISNTFSIRNWNIENGRSLINRSFGYTYFDNEYRIKKSKGEVVAGWDNIKDQTEGIYFVNGSLTINADNSISSDKYLVVVVKGNLTINQEVKKLEGIFIVDGNVSIAGENASNDQLVINGMIYAGGSVTITRSYADHKLNNTLPATIIYFRPDLIFNLPGDLSKTVSGWREGR